MRIRDFVRENRGQAALEFAVLLPLMLTTLLGGVEFGDGIALSRKTEITARTVADLASQYNNPNMSNILGASSGVITPYSAANLVLTISGVNVNSTGKATIVWSTSLNGTARTMGPIVTLPTGTATADSPYCLIWGEASYSYMPTLGYVLTGALTLARQIFMSPRLWGGVTYNSSRCPT